MDMARKNDLSFSKLKTELYGLKKEPKYLDTSEEQSGSRNRYDALSSNVQQRFVHEPPYSD